MWKRYQRANKRDCIVESCEPDTCFFKPRWESTDFKTNFVMYHQFQCVKDTYVSKKDGETKEVNNWTRINVTSTFSDIQNLLHLCGKKYLMHRRSILNQNAVMPVIFSFTELGYIFWCVFSENLKIRPKYETQEAHFEDKEYTLHCTVAYQSSTSHNYHYHLRNDRTHDSVFTEQSK